MIIRLNYLLLCLLVTIEVEYTQELTASVARTNYLSKFFFLISNVYTKYLLYFCMQPRIHKGNFSFTHEVEILIMQDFEIHLTQQYIATSVLWFSFSY